MSLISIIVPVFNVAEYLPRCLNSIINQTYSDLEVIIVDDGSTDGSPLICDEYASMDSRIKVVHKLNGGLSSARNTGLDMCTGEFVIFIDSDDWMDVEMVKSLYDAICSTGADIATCGIINVFADHQEKTSANSASVVIHKKEAIYRGLVDKSTNIRTEVWNKLWKKSVIGDNRFKVGQVYEDVYFNRVVLRNVEKIATVDLALYYYMRYRPGSTQTTFNKKGLCLFDELSDLIEDVREQGMSQVADLIENEALENAVGYYVSAIDFSVEKQIRYYIKSQFERFYANRVNNSNLKKVRYLVFHLSPYLYLGVRKIRNLLMK